MDPVTRPSDHREPILGWVVLAAALAACNSSKTAATADGSRPGADASDAGTRDDATNVTETGADTASEVAVNACSTRATRVPALEARTVGPGGGAYEGPA